MSINNFYENLKDILEDKTSILEMFFVFKDKSIKKAVLENQIEEKLYKQFCELLTVTINEKTTYKEINELDDISIENEYLYFKNDAIYDKLKYIIEVCNGKIAPVKGLKEDIFALLFKIGSDENYILLYQQCYAMNFLKKGSSYLSLFSEGNVFKEISSNILNIHNRIDFICNKDFFIVLNVSVLEKQYAYEEVILRSARDVISSINFIENIEILYENLTLRDAKRLKNAKNEDVLVMFNTQFDKIKKFAKNHKELKELRFKEDKIELKDKKDIDALIKLLNNNYLHSKLTRTDYISISKRKIK